MEEKTYINKYIRIPVWLFMLFVNIFLYLSLMWLILWLIPASRATDFTPVFLDGLKRAGIATFFTLIKYSVMRNGVYLRNSETKKGVHISWKEYKAIREFNVREFWTAIKKLDDSLKDYRRRMLENDEDEYEENLEKAKEKIKSVN